MPDRNTLIGIILAGALTCAHAQWLNYPHPRTPHTRDGKPNLSAPAPRLNGKPDLSGVWVAQGDVPESGVLDTGGGDFALSKYAFNILADFKPEEAPMRPEARAILQQREQGHGKDSPSSHCLSHGIPLINALLPFKMIQTRVEIVMLIEDNNPPRQIYLDGRKLPRDPQPSWMGYSSGSWRGDTLVVGTIGFNDRIWLDTAGHPQSEAMHLTERFHRRDFGHMDLEMTLDDPKYYTRPFTIKLGLMLIPDSDVLESVCAENEKDRIHLDRP